MPSIRVVVAAVVLLSTVGILAVVVVDAISSAEEARQTLGIISALLVPVLSVLGALIYGSIQHMERHVEATHHIVNSQRTATLRLIVSLANRIAADNPADLIAKAALALAEADLRDAEAKL